MKQTAKEKKSSQCGIIKDKSGVALRKLFSIILQQIRQFPKEIKTTQF